MSERVLIVDDEEIVRTNIREYLAGHGYDVDEARDGAAALERVLDDDYSLVITDIRMPKMDGIELLQRIVLERPETFVLIMTAYASVETAVEALRLGAYDYILKPVIFEDLRQRIRNLLAYSALKDEVLRLRRDITDRLGFEGIIGESPAMGKIFDLIDRVAPTTATVLISGESGTGKELVARAIHERSNIANREFVAVNMAALPQELVESMLFGHEKGAFTGAERSRPGVMRTVRGGSVFLDEIGEVPLALQPKLLRAVESHEILPVGAERPTIEDFRLIAATNRDLGSLVEQSLFRQDLYFRLDVFRIEIPPLRERREDIPALATHFLKLHGRALGLGQLRISNRAMKSLISYSWPGNVRELSNVIERASILSDDARVHLEHLPAEIIGEQELPTGLRSAVEAFERKHIAWVIRAAGGNREQAAKMLEIDPATLYRRVAKYKLGKT